MLHTISNTSDIFMFSPTITYLFPIGISKALIVKLITSSIYTNGIYESGQNFELIFLFAIPITVLPKVLKSFGPVITPGFKVTIGSPFFKKISICFSVKYFDLLYWLSKSSLCFEFSSAIIPFGCLIAATELI